MEGDFDVPLRADDFVGVVGSSRSTVVAREEEADARTRLVCFLALGLGVTFDASGSAACLSDCSRMEDIDVELDTDEIDGAWRLRFATEVRLELSPDA